MAGILRGNRNGYTLYPVTRGAACRAQNDQYPGLPCDHVQLPPKGVVLLGTANLSGEAYDLNHHRKEAISMDRAIRSSSRYTSATRSGPSVG